MSKITVVGCGVMGSALIRAFMKAGHNITIVDKNPAAAQPFIAEGATFKSSLDDALNCDFILLNLPDHKIAMQVIEQCKSQDIKGKIIVNTTTTTPKQAQIFEEMIKEKGAIALESVIICYPHDIGTHRAYLVYSGPKEAFDQIEDQLAALSQPHFVGTDIRFAEIIEMSTSALQFGFYWFALLGSALCIRNNLSVSEYCKHIKTALPVVGHQLVTHLPDNLENYTGKFKDATVASLDIHTHGLQTIIKTLEDNNIDISVCEVMEKQMKAAIDAGYGKCDFEAAITQLLK
ncbi:MULTISPECIES: NAD(P)-binding domain-containing protein [Bacillus]|uniref:NAD(P)-binding domain-containing protein n=1 Tax=Bacillus TaxID=1386 RepID=UPI001B339FFB|nr:MULTISPECIES: NAD(P)-binding domain-containing protein [Bacillus]MBP3972435.1 NAD(P)-binding domain-containing protein [Bacillus sp. WL1]UOB81714.1 NAD(P)-binding domain-containing protein [Bacillus sp. ZJS3]